MTKHMIAEKKVMVNIFPDPWKYIALELPKIAIESDKIKRLDMAKVMLDALRELQVKKDHS